MCPSLSIFFQQIYKPKYHHFKMHFPSPLITPLLSQRKKKMKEKPEVESIFFKDQISFKKKEKKRSDIFQTSKISKKDFCRSMQTFQIFYKI